MHRRGWRLVLAGGLMMAALALLGPLNATIEARRSVDDQALAVAALEPMIADLHDLAVHGTRAPGSGGAPLRLLGTAFPDLGAKRAAYLNLREALDTAPHPYAARHAAARFAAALAARTGLVAASSPSLARLAQVPAAMNAAARHAVLLGAAQSIPAPRAALRLDIRRSARDVVEKAHRAGLHGSFTDLAMRRSPGDLASRRADGLVEAHSAFQTEAVAVAAGLTRAVLQGLDAERQGLEQRLVLLGATIVLALLGAVAVALNGQLSKRRLRSPPGGRLVASGRSPRGYEMSLSLSRAVGKSKLTVAIGTMVITSIAVAIVAVVGALAWSYSDQSRSNANQHLASSIRTAAALLEINLPGADIIWTSAGEVERIEAPIMPTFRTHDLIDNIGRVTGDAATIFEFDPETGDFVRATTNILTASGDRAVGTVLARDGAAYPVVRSGGTYSGQADILGTGYYTIYQPIVDTTGAIRGLLSVNVPKAQIDGAAVQNLMLLGVVGLVALVVIGTIAGLVSRALTRPIPRLSAAMAAISDGDLDAPVPYTDLGNEIGTMARTVEVFRQNSKRMLEMTDAEQAAEAKRVRERAAMVAELRQSFGEVVDAAVEGDFTKRVTADFADKELQELAQGINSLVGSVDQGLCDTRTVLGALAEADLTRRMDGSYRGAFAELRDSTNAVADKLTSIVGGLRDTSRSLSVATAEILAGSNDLNDRTTKQAATIQETSAAIEQVSAAVGHNAKRAREANGAAGTVSHTAEEGGRMMRNATEAMERITESSDKISNIIGLIDDIAFQTNLLALNASVEAARAGEAGKGFAVVAVEVRRLAQSAAQASSEVKALIDRSAGEVKQGSRLVAEAAQKLGTMLEAARTCNTLMDGIARESAEQASAIEEVTAAVRQLDEMTQHNAALVEQTNAAIEQTEAQATALDRIVDIFSLGEAAAPPAAPEPARGVRAMQEKVKTAARSYLSRGNTAIDEDWSEF